jgi:RHH-type proline utilization regulon transcriptional repressor/proline dehydrogenase/delta 1-pyrroline-5-carboxylate dehydrogenase
MAGSRLTKALFACRRTFRANQACCRLGKDEVVFDAVLHRRFRPVACGLPASGQAGRCDRGVQGLSQGETNIALERLVIERALSVNTAAAGGNASLMTIG